MEILKYFPEEENIQKIYNDLRKEENKRLLINLGKMIIDFFQVIDGYLLYAVYDYQNKYNLKKDDVDNNDYIKVMRNNLEKYYQKNKCRLKNCVTIYEKEINLNKVTSQKATFTKKENSIVFVKKIIIDKKATYYQLSDQQNFFLFEHYYGFYKIIKDITKDLDAFFQDKQNIKFKNKYEKAYQIATDNLKLLSGVLEEKTTTSFTAE